MLDAGGEAIRRRRGWVGVCKSEAGCDWLAGRWEATARFSPSGRCRHLHCDSGGGESGQSREDAAPAEAWELRWSAAACWPPPAKQQPWGLRRRWYPRSGGTWGCEGVERGDGGLWQGRGMILRELGWWPGGWATQEKKVRGGEKRWEWRASRPKRRRLAKGLGPGNLDPRNGFPKRLGDLGRGREDKCTELQPTYVTTGEARDPLVIKKLRPGPRQGMWSARCPHPGPREKAGPGVTISNKKRKTRPPPPAPSRPGLG